MREFLRDVSSARKDCAADSCHSHQQQENSHCVIITSGECREVRPIPFLTTASNSQLTQRVFHEVRECQAACQPCQKCNEPLIQFCVYSPYGNMQSLIQVQQRDIQYERVDPNRTHLMQDYGKQTLGKMKTLVGGDQPNNLT